MAWPYLHDRRPLLGQLLADHGVLVLGQGVGLALIASASAMPLAGRPALGPALGRGRGRLGLADEPSRLGAGDGVDPDPLGLGASSRTCSAEAWACSSTSWRSASAPEMRASRAALARVTDSYALASAGLRMVAWRRCSSRWASSSATLVSSTTTC